MPQALLRRTAESLYWAGRHLERAEDLTRIVLVHGNTHVDLPVGQEVGWMPLLEVAGVAVDFVESHPSLFRTPGATAAEGDVVDFLLAGPANPSSIVSCVSSVRDAMRACRTVVPREAWELTNALWLTMRERLATVHTRDGRVRWMRRTIGDCERINGSLWATMPRDGAMAVIRIGQHLERAIVTCRLLAVRADSALGDAPSDEPFDHLRAMSLLKALAAFQQFRRAMPARPAPGSVVSFMLRDETFPRSVASCLGQVRQALKELPGNEQALAACAEATVATVGAPLATTPGSLRVQLDRLTSLLGEIHLEVASSLFLESTEVPRAPPGPRPVAQPPRAVRRYEVVHRSTYRYDEAAEESASEARLRPRSTVRQRVLSSTISIDPAPSNRTDLLDAFGNHVTSFLVQGPFDELVVTSRSDVELLEAPEPPTGAPWESVWVTLERDRRLDARVARGFRVASRLVPSHQALAAYAQESFTGHRPIVDALRELCGRIHADFVYEPGFTSVTTPVLEVFEQRRGVCQDFAHVAIGCLRSMGLAARYVSGYIETFRTGHDQLTGADASHAWASTYLPGWGWLDLDPTNDLLGCAEHVTTAWGRDYEDVSPLRGSVVGGGRTHGLEVSVEVRRLEPAP